MILNAIIQESTNKVIFLIESTSLILTQIPDFVLEVPDETVVEVGWTYVPGDTPESYTFVPPAPIEE